MIRQRLDRMRHILGGRPREEDGAECAARRLGATSGRHLEQVASRLGGQVERDRHAGAIIVHRTYAPSHGYGQHALETYPRPSRSALEILGGDPPGAEAGPETPDVVCFDLETTGLSGGAGTIAWIIGLGWFQGGGFETRQFLLANLGAERDLLGLVSNALGRHRTLLTFNGRSFDGPVAESRFVLHRLPSPLEALRHVDLLPASRHLWTGDDGRLVNLERDVLRLRRVGDVHGAEIPGRYHAFLRSGDAEWLEPVLEHNRLDLISLGILAGLACEVVRGGVSHACGASQAFGLGRLYERVGLRTDAIACYRRAAGLGPSGRPDDQAWRPPGSPTDRDVCAAALARLGALYRRQRRHGDAAAAWSRLLALPGLSSRLRREASVALAVHHEHRDRDLPAARRYATTALDISPQPRQREAVEQRLRRLDRKLIGGGRRFW